MNTES